MAPHGLVLAAGAGSRMGTPKALVHDDDGTSWVRRAVATLREGGCAEVVVVLGAAADEASPLLADTDATVVVADDWAHGMSASLRRGLLAVAETDAPAVVLTLVDLPDVSSAVVARLLADPVDPRTLRRAAYDGVPGHPVLIGRHHWPGIAESATGDEGARAYLRHHAADLVECGDLATGHDVDQR